MSWLRPLCVVRPATCRSGRSGGLRHRADGPPVRQGEPHGCENRTMNEMEAREVLAAAGFPGGAELLALGENAVFTADGLVVKVGRDAVRHPELRERAALEVAVARWLAASGVPAVRTAEEGARLVEGHPVTVWHRLPDAVRAAEPRDLAPLLTA